MAHVKHFKMSDVKRLSNELTREDYQDNDNRIDKSKSHLNYVLDDSVRYGVTAQSADTMTQRTISRVGEIPHANRKDLNVISDWVVTCPRELLNDPVKVSKFFEVTYSFIQNRYGAENVLQGFVHMDEKTPHAHIAVVPQADGGTISSKSLFTRKELQSFHKDLESKCSAEFGIQGLILNGRTKGNYTVKELKERDQREKAIAEKEKIIEYNHSIVLKNQQKLKESESDLNRRNAEYLIKQKRLDNRQSMLDYRERSLAEQESRLSNRELDLVEQRAKVESVLESLSTLLNEKPAPIEQAFITAYKQRNPDNYAKFVTQYNHKVIAPITSATRSINRGHEFDDMLSQFERPSCNDQLGY